MVASDAQLSELLQEIATPVGAQRRLEGVEAEGTYAAGVRMGVWTRRVAGRVRARAHFYRGQLHGVFELFYGNGVRAVSANFQNGEMVGRVLVWRPTGEGWVASEVQRDQRWTGWRKWQP